MDTTDHTKCGLDFPPDYCHEGYDEINERSVAIVLAGNFQVQYPTKEQQLALKKLVTDLQQKYQIPKERVIGHYHASDTACPGSRIIDILWK